MKFGVQSADRRRADILIGVKAVTTNSHSDSVDFRLVWTHSAYKIAVGDFAVWWYLLRLDEEYGVVTFNNIAWFV